METLLKYIAKRIVKVADHTPPQQTTDRTDYEIYAYKTITIEIPEEHIELLRDWIESE